jgi:hypothetical protein
VALIRGAVAFLLSAGMLAAAGQVAPASAGGGGAGAGPAVGADPGTPWPMHTITSGPRGADGTDLADVNDDGLNDVTSAWEQAGLVTVSLHPGAGAEAEPWPTVDVATRLFGVEDAIFADVDEDGNTDVVTACECRKVVVYFGPEPSQVLDPAAWTAVEITGFGPDPQRWIKVAVADVDGDGRPDVIGGGKVAPATVGWFRAPENPRDGSAWTYTAMSDVGWTMSLVARDVDGDADVDVVMSDRTPMRLPDKTIIYGLRGTRWLENQDHGAGWTNHTIGFAGAEHRFLDVVDYDGDGVDDVVDTAFGRDGNTITFRRNLGGWLSWDATALPSPGDGVGQVQDVRVVDMDLDGDLDLVFSHAHADGDLSGVVWLAAQQDGSWLRGEVSGSPGTKYDNVSLEDVDLDGDPDIVTSEQIEQLGVVWYENPTVG